MKLIDLTTIQRDSIGKITKGKHMKQKILMTQWNESTKMQRVRDKRFQYFISKGSNLDKIPEIHQKKGIY